MKELTLILIAVALAAQDAPKPTAPPPDPITEARRSQILRLQRDALYLANVAAEAQQHVNEAIAAAQRDCGARGFDANAVVCGAAKENPTKGGAK